ncbi:hypothetical protein M408DRAFT_295459 [Serendipita vermifera MAFF 305830]|uniref:Uncharacterized protein n=1 Tax=Serendipita vermifera MAFF 305830 TaxID=933852 RepID=A0A0C3BFK7_SERVB|nr:hypothetical protein M408DRAFT_295459 [Serendipita vermifera MAFF 305830]
MPDDVRACDATRLALPTLGIAMKIDNSYCRMSRVIGAPSGDVYNRVEIPSGFAFHV